MIDIAGCGVAYTSGRAMSIGCADNVSTIGDRYGATLSRSPASSLFRYARVDVWSAWWRSGRSRSLPPDVSLLAGLSSTTSGVRSMARGTPMTTGHDPTDRSTTGSTCSLQPELRSGR